MRVYKGKFLFEFENEIEFRSLYKEIFDKNLYYCEFDTKEPEIIDCGAHIGLASLYFSALAERPKIRAFEPVPELFELLKKNIELNGLKEVIKPIQAAVADSKNVELFIDSEEKNRWLSTSSINRGAWTGKERTVPIQVAGVKLSEIISGPIDLLKMDIEGAEKMVLKEIKPNLHLIKRLMIEIHRSIKMIPDEITDLLTKSGFTLEVSKGSSQVSLNKLKVRKQGLYLLTAVRK